MPEDQRERLRGIRTFPSLVKYLHDELDWPITPDDFEDQTFDYSPEELGIDSKNAAKIQEIKRLRPLTAKQPWGIFFVKFEPKRLPVVALRRILNQVVLKKRASANSVERAAWELDDLLFVSNYGDGDERSISFAHFKQEKDKHLPSLKELGWDNLDTSLHLDHVAYELREKLHWPGDENNADKWREDWRSAFTVAHREAITTSRDLAIILAELARAIRDRTRSVLDIETEDGPVTKLMDAFKESLIHDLDEDDFADMYAQTITYGLLSARIANPDGDNTTDSFSNHLSVTNPFLRELMETFLHTDTGKVQKRNTAIDFDELGVSEVVDLLDNANMEAVVIDFGNRNPQEDPVIHFYELFLKEYDAKKRMKRGVFYTPRPVVSFIVRSVDELLKKEFGLEDGLADITTWGEMTEKFDDLEIPEGATPDQAFVQILDPATGTGTFLVEVIDVIYNTMKEKWEKEHGPLLADVDKRWNEYVPKHLLSRLFGYELLMAPYAIAHMKIGLKLVETGYGFKNDERVRVYLTNSLEPAQEFSGTLDFGLPALAHEAQSVNRIKASTRFSVVIGNPPYSISSSNKSSWIMELISAYKKDLDEINVNSLSDDYIKFLCFVEHINKNANIGVVGMITNNSYLSGITHRQMRKSLIFNYNYLYCLDLHGSATMDHAIPNSQIDENVFDIQQGVAISLFYNKRMSKIPARVFHHDCNGTRSYKYSVLLDKDICTMQWSKLEPQPENYFLMPFDSELAEEYYQGWPVNKIFKEFATGIKFRKDNLLVKYHFTEDSVHEMLCDIHTLSKEDLLNKYNFNETRDWRIEDKKCYFDSSRITEIKKVAYRPFDERYTYYPLDEIRSIIVRGDSRANLMTHLLSNRNLALVTTRLNRQISTGYFLVTRDIIDLHLLDNARDSMQVFPLYLFRQQTHFGHKFEKEVNFTDEFLTCFNSTIRDSDILAFTPEQILSYAYAVFHSPEYRNRYSEYLKIDFPYLPLTSNHTLFLKLSQSGRELIDFHLMESCRINNYLTTLIGSTNCLVEKVSYSDGTVWIDKAKTQGFKGVPEEVWNFHIGGYQVCEKWLKDRQAKGGKHPRPGRILSDVDIEHYQKIVVALNETIRIMKEIDEVIEEHGGWPGAFHIASE